MINSPQLIYTLIFQMLLIVYITIYLQEDVNAMEYKVWLSTYDIVTTVAKGNGSFLVLLD